MNVGFDLFIAFVMAIATFIVIKSLGQGAGNSIKFLGALAVVLPLAVILLTGMVEMQVAGTNTSAMNSAENKTITSITDWFVNALPGAVISDMGGILAGAVIGIFTGGR